MNLVFPVVSYDTLHKHSLYLGREQKRKNNRSSPNNSDNKKPSNTNQKRVHTSPKCNRYFSVFWIHKEDTRETVVGKEAAQTPSRFNVLSLVPINYPFIWSYSYQRQSNREEYKGNKLYTRESSFGCVQTGNPHWFRSPSRSDPLSSRSITLIYTIKDMPDWLLFVHYSCQHSTTAIEFGPFSILHARLTLLIFHKKTLQHSLHLKSSHTQCNIQIVTFNIYIWIDCLLHSTLQDKEQIHEGSLSQPRPLTVPSAKVWRTDGSYSPIRPCHSRTESICRCHSEWASLQPHFQHRRFLQSSLCTLESSHNPK